MKSRLAGSSFDDKRRQQRKTEIQLVLIVGRGTQQRKTKPVRTGGLAGAGRQGGLTEQGTSEPRADPESREPGGLPQEKEPEAEGTARPVALRKGWAESWGNSW